MAKPTEVGGLAPSTPLADAALSIVLARLGDLRRHELALFRAVDEDEVHDMRVAARRLRAAIQMFGKRPLRDVEPEVEMLQDALGDVRDVHVQREWLAKVREEDRAEAASLEALDREQAHRLVTAERALLLALKRWVELGAPAVQRAAHHVKTKGPFRGDVTSAVLDKALKRLEATRDAALESRAPEILHTFRIRLKKFRYLSELLGAALEPEMEQRLDIFAEIQDQVGALHDLDVRITLLSGPAWSVPKLLERLQKERTQAAVEIQKRLGKLTLS